MTSSMQRNLAPGLVTMVELDKPLVFSLNEETRRVWFVFFFDLYMQLRFREEI